MTFLRHTPPTFFGLVAGIPRIFPNVTSLAAFQVLKFQGSLILRGAVVLLSSPQEMITIFFVCVFTQYPQTIQCLTPTANHKTDHHNNDKIIIISEMIKALLSLFDHKGGISDTFTPSHKAYLSETPLEYFHFDELNSCQHAQIRGADHSKQLP